MTRITGVSTILQNLEQPNQRPKDRDATGILDVFAYQAW